MKSPLRFMSSLILATSLFILLIVAVGCLRKKGEFDYSRMAMEFVDNNGAGQKPIQELEAGESLSLGFSGLQPGAPLQVYLNDDQGKEWSYARMFADKEGVIKPTLFWYQSGVIGTTSRKISFKPDPAFVTFEEAEAYFQNHPLILTVKTLKGKIVGEKPLPLVQRRKPLLYPSNSKGILVNAFDLATEDIYATGKYFSAGSSVQLFAVQNKYTWALGDAFKDISGRGGVPEAETIRLNPDQTNFTVKIWDHENGIPGSFDLIARIGNETRPEILRENDILSYGEDTGMLFYIIINGNIVIESAGRMKNYPAYFEFSDSFEKNEDVYAAVDPTDVPASHAGGNYAAYFVVDHQPIAYWDGPSPVLSDVSFGVEIHRVKYWCINVPRKIVWPGATQTEPIKAYDLIVDFGSTPANDAASYIQDNIYNKGYDFIDGYNSDAGFWVFEDPSTTGPYPVGQVELDDPSGISGITDPSGVTGPTENVTLAWARIMYPAVAAGTGTGVHASASPCPIALFLHGRHKNCDDDGNGPGLTGGYSFGCSSAHRIPSHEGYNYIMQQLASQGIFCISISAHDIQPDLGIWDYDARGRLILKFLDKLRDWNDHGIDPFGGIFSGKLDMSKIALSGHSRGGEGVVAAQVLNKTWPTPHSIVAVNAIAPTDQNTISYIMTDAAYFLLVGARDGDVTSMQGFRTYDRASPEGLVPRFTKTVAWVFGANHNYFNTIWTDTAALGYANPWAGSKDDAGLVTVDYAMPAAAQRQIALSTICAFFRQYLQGITAYKEIFTGRLKPSAMANPYVYWTYQDAQRKAVDNFEQTPLDKTHNTLSGTVSAPGFTTFDEKLLNYSSSDYPPGYPADHQFYHDTLGLKLAWAAGNTYTTNIPAGHSDVSGYSHLSFRAAKQVTGIPATGPDVNFYVNLEDGSGHHGVYDFRTDQFNPIPHPYKRDYPPNQCLLIGVRIPLNKFTMNNSGVDLTNIVRITIRTEGSGEVGIDDIEFGK